MKNRMFSTDQPKGLMRQNSELNLDKDSLKNKQMRQMRQMKSVNKQLGIKKRNFFFQEGEKIVGDYKFDARKQIGTGYSSKVYKAVSLKDNQDYAIKAIQFKNFKPSHFEMLQNEIKVLKKIAHSNVLKFQSVSKTSTHLYIITEFCQKGDLLTHMTRKGVLQEKQALNIFGEILNGMQYLFKLGIIHRDIKPGNILFDGKNWKLADFGFAIEAKEQIKTRNNVGTPLYMPLQSLQKNLYSAQSDIFSIGVVLYQLLVGITPWECRDQQELIRKLKNIEFRIPEKNKISPQIKQLIKKMCEPIKQNRMTRRQFLTLDPNYFKNYQSSNNVFKKDLIQNSKVQTNLRQINPSAIKRKISIKNLSGEFRLKQLVQKNQDIKQKISQKPRNELNLFTNGKMKRSSQNVMTEGQQSSIRQLTKIKSASNLFSPNMQQHQNNQESPQGKMNINFKDRSQKQNRNILLSLLNFCRFMYYLMKNTQYLQVNDLNKQKLKVILSKHSIALLKQLSDYKNNWFNLQNYQNYKQTKNYFRLFASFQQYLTKYQKQYDSLIKRFEGAVVKEINQKISQFTLDDGVNLSQNFYRKLLVFIAPILRQNNHNLASQIINNKKKLTQQIKCKIQGIKQFFKYFRLLQILSKQNSTYEYFEQNSNIQVVKTYNQSTPTVEQFMNLRKQMKFI